MTTTQESAKVDLRLRPQPRRVTRLSRKVLVGLGGLSGLVVLAATIWALESSRDGNQEAGQFGTDRHVPADGLEMLPKDYSGIPQLGPPLPGDLGRPIRRAQEKGRPVIVPPAVQPSADPDEQRRLSEMESARVAKLFAAIAGVSASPTLDALEGARDLNAGHSAALGQGTADPDRKQAFVDEEVDRRVVSTDRLYARGSDHLLQAGTVIPAALITGIRSDLPGMVTAQVTSHVYDTPTGQYLLIPQGARLIGEYDSQVAFGQRRVQLVWSRLIMPDGSSIVLERLPGSDVEGFSGLEDEVNRHWGQLFGAVALSTLLGVSTELTISDESDLARAVRESAQDSVSDVGEEIVRRQLDVQPTLTIRQGHPLRVIVNRDLVLKPYQADTTP